MKIAEAQKIIDEAQESLDFAIAVFKEDVASMNLDALRDHCKEMQAAGLRLSSSYVVETGLQGGESFIDGDA